MLIQLTRVGTLACVAVLGLTPVAGQTGKVAVGVECATLPAAVRAAAAKTKTKPGTTQSCEKITEHGETLFEVKVTSPAGKMVELVYRPNGEIEEWEEEAEMSAVPAKARRVLQDAKDRGVLRKVDLIHRGKRTLYEGEYRDGEKKSKLIVDAEGRPVPAT